MSDDAEVVIVGADGAEHVFPPGFDPKQAAAIVRGESSGRAPALSRPVLGSSVGDMSDATSAVDRLNESLQPLAHPQTAGDMTGLLIPAGVETAIAAAKGYGAAARDAIQGGSTLRQLPGGMLRMLYQRAFPTADQMEAARMAEKASRTAPDIARGADMYAMPRVERTVDLAPKAAQVIGEASRTAPDIARGADISSAGSVLSTEQRAQLAKQGYSSELIDKIEAQMAQPPAPGTTAGTLRARPPIEPMPAHEPTIAPTAPELQQPRVDIGAEKVGRQIGLSKEQVRQQTAPILGEQPGEASPILPEQALRSIIDTMKALPKDGPERAAYVAKATSGKTQWQVENIRRTLEHLGLLAPVATAIGPSIRDALLRQMRAGVTDGSPND